MAEFKLTINDPKTGKSYQKALSTDIFKNKKLRESVKGDALGLKGYELEIVGGSDTAGFPMRYDLSGVGRKKISLAGGCGVRIKRKGVRKRKTVRGNTISLQTAQINLKITKYGTKKVEEVFGENKEEIKKEEKTEEKKEEKPEEKTEQKQEKKEEPKKEEKK